VHLPHIIFLETSILWYFLDLWQICALLVQGTVVFAESCVTEYTRIHTLSIPEEALIA